MTKPCPLQSFWPWQALWAVAQADVPLQSFTPWHLILAGSAAFAADTATVPKSSAAAVAIAAPLARPGARTGSPLDTDGGCCSVVKAGPPPARQSWHSI